MNGENNVGIGTVNPRAKLDISGNLFIAGGNQIQITNSTGAAGLQLIGSDGGLNILGTLGASEPLAFRTSATERIRIDINGNVGVGTASPEAKLHVAGVNLVDTLKAKEQGSTFPISGSESANNAHRLAFGWSSLDEKTRWRFRSSGGGNNHIQIDTYSPSTDMFGVSGLFGAFRGAAVGYSDANTTPPTNGLIVNGNVGIGTTTPGYKLDVLGDINSSSCFRVGATTVGGTCTSDVRLKENIEDYTAGLKDILRIRLRTYQFNGLGEMPRTGETSIGVIAQELETTHPDLVKTRLVKLHPEDSTKTEIKVVDYSRFTYMLINAVKELYSETVSLSKDLVVQNHKIAEKADQAEIDLKIRRLELENAQIKSENQLLKNENVQIKSRLEQIEKILGTNNFH